DDAWGLRGDFAEFQAENVQALRRPGQELVVGKRRQPLVERRIDVAIGFRRGGELLLLADQRPQRRDVALAGLPRRPRRDIALDQLPRLVELFDLRRAQRQEKGQRLQELCRPELRDEYPAAMPDFEHAENAQRPDRLAQRRPADIEGLGQLALRRQLVAGAEIARRYQP